MKDNSVGIIPIRKIGSSYQFLLVHEIDDHWGFPKGHPNPRESEIETVARELFEETGIDSFDYFEDFRFVGKYSYQKDNVIVNKDVVFFLGFIEEGKRVQPTSEVKRAEWFSFDRALDTLTYRESRNMLKKAQVYIRNLVSPAVRRHQYVDR